MADVCTKISHKESVAIKALETACKLSPTNYPIQWRLIKIYFNYTLYQKVIDLLPPLHNHMHETPCWAFILGKSYYLIPSRNEGKAIKYLEIGLEEDPANAEAAYLLGRMYFNMENYKNAVHYYQLTLSIDSTSQPVRTYKYAIVLYTAGQFGASAGAFKQAVDRGYPRSDALLRNWTYANIEAGMTGDAIDTLKEMLQRRPQAGPFLRWVTTKKVMNSASGLLS